MELYLNKRKLWRHTKDLDLLKCIIVFAGIPPSFDYSTVTDEECLQAVRWRLYGDVP